MAKQIADHEHPRLRPGCSLYRRAGVPFIGGTVAGRVRQAMMNPKAAAILQLCDGGRTLEEVAATTADRLGEDVTVKAARFVVRQVLLRHRSFLTTVEQTGAVGDTAAVGLEERLPGVDLEGLHTIYWFATGRCERDCRYCNARDWWWWGLGPEPRAGEMPRFVARAAAAGVPRMVISGGEPLLQPDIHDVLAAGCGGGMDVFVTTKHGLDAAEIGRLVDTGLEQITLSVDAADEVGDFLVEDGYVAESLEAAQRLAERGLWVAVAPVATRVNQHQVIDLVDRAIECGVGELQIYTYACTGRPIDAELDLSEEERERLFATLRQVTLERQGEILIGFGFGRDTRRFTGSPSSVPLGCATGRRSLAVLPNGKITRCQYFEHDDIIYGDVRHDDPIQAWRNGLYLRRPDPALYAGTPCEGCPDFQACHDRGRCLGSAYEKYGTLFAPDFLCPRGLGDELQPECSVET